MARPTNFQHAQYGDLAQSLVPQVGAKITPYLSAGALNVGDIVFVSAARTVNRSATAANYAGYAGVVVGGTATNGIAFDHNEGREVGQVATTAAGQRVLVADLGSVVYSIADGAVTAGTNFSVIPSATTAGRVIAGTTAGQIVGVPLTSTTAAGQAILLKVEHR